MEPTEPRHEVADRIATMPARSGFVFGRVGIVPEAASSWFLRVASFLGRIRGARGPRPGPGAP